jgi:hypothetical protein
LKGLLAENQKFEVAQFSIENTGCPISSRRWSKIREVAPAGRYYGVADRENKFPDRNRLATMMSHAEI